MKLTDEFIKELFHLALKDEKVLLILLKHLKFSYLTTEVEKTFFQKIKQIYTLKNRIPSFGLLQIEFRKNEKLLNYVLEVKEAIPGDKDEMLQQFQDFIKESKFVEVFDKASELYNYGKREQAIKLFQKGAEELVCFSIKEDMFDLVFKGFEERIITTMFNVL